MGKFIAFRPTKLTIAILLLVLVSGALYLWVSGSKKQEKLSEQKSSVAAGTAKKKKGGGGMPGMSMPGMGGGGRGGEDGKKLESKFYVSPRRQQMIGVRTEEVKVRPMTKEIRAVGIVEIDERKIEHLHTKISGWIEKVFVDFTWQFVDKGDPLFSIYSPELVATQEELLLALRYKRGVKKSEFGEVREGAQALVEAARRRLRLWDISEAQIRELERTGEVKRSLVIYSPIRGYVSYKNAFENMYVTPATEIYSIADYSTVWMQAEVYENEISLVKLGQKAIVTVTSLPGEKFYGRVTYLLPKVDYKARTLKVRTEFPNPDLKLLPKMYADVEIDIPLGDRLAVAKSAVLRTGKRDLVFVDLGEGNIELRRVLIGFEAGDYYEVLKGLREGERVVSSANFLIDAESQLKAVASTWGEGSEGKEALAPPPGKNHKDAGEKRPAKEKVGTESGTENEPSHDQGRTGGGK